jgi:hypothetical protein
VIRAAAGAGHRPMRLWTHDRWRFPLPEHHRFPIDKYALLRERVVADGTARADEVLEADAAPWEWLAAVHDGCGAPRSTTAACWSGSGRAG